MSGKVVAGQVIVSICYIGLLLMFAFTSLCFEVIVKDHQSFLPMFNHIQSTWSGLLVNIGMLVMLLIDYGYDKKYIPRWAVIFSVVIIGITLLVYYFAENAIQTKSYEPPFNWPWLGTVLYGTFIVYLIVIKFCSLPHINTQLNIKEDYKKQK